MSGKDREASLQKILILIRIKAGIVIENGDWFDTMQIRTAKLPSKNSNDL